MLETINERYAAETCRDQDTWQSWSSRDRARHVVRTARARFFHCSTDLAIVVPVRTMLELHVVPSPSSKETVTLLITLFEYTRDVHFSAHFVSTGHLFSPFHPILLKYPSISIRRLFSFYPTVPRREARYPRIAEIPVDVLASRITTGRRNGTFVIGPSGSLSALPFSFFFFLLCPEKSGNRSLEKYRGVHAALDISSGELHNRRGILAGNDDTHTRGVYTHEKTPFLLSGLAEPN